MIFPTRCQVGKLSSFDYTSTIHYLLQKIGIMFAGENSHKIENGVTPFSSFISYHKAQLEMSGVPPQFWEVLSTKLKDQLFDAGESFSILKLEDDEREIHEPQFTVQALNDIRFDDPRHIYLIDHAWTYRINTAMRHLREIPGLLDRMAGLMGLADRNLPREELVSSIFKEMWKYNQTYTLNGLSVDIEDRMPVWYIMDEFGSAIQHSDEPNFRTVPLVHLPDQVTYTLLFPTKNISAGDTVTRDYVEGHIDNEDKRKALLLPWQPKSFLDHNYDLYEPDVSYFLDGHIQETLPIPTAISPPIEPKAKLKVYSEYRYINEYLKHPRFEIVFNETEGDILWFMFHFKSYQELSEQCPWKFINQFPFENVITIKDLLSIVSRRKASNNRPRSELLETLPVWLPTTFNLKTELIQFVSYYQHREEKGLDNHWIIKPWNLARGLDTYITNNLNFILKLFFSGPKIVQKYIERPVLFTRPEVGQVKFDIRYVVLLKTVNPLQVYGYKNFFLRFANHMFEMKDFDDYEKHFTVMNYQEDTPLCRLLAHEFIQSFGEQYPNIAWVDVEAKIFDMLYEVFDAATSEPPPRGIVHSPQSRALYAADIMLEWKEDERGRATMQPKLLEINWTPDCRRACEYYADFYNDIFGLLFLDEMKDVFKKLEKN